MSVNKVILLGNVGKDPEVRYFDNGGCVANFPLATTERGYTAANGTQVPDRTEWHNIVVWRRLAETVEKYVKKGAKLYIEGKIHSRSYDDANGVKRYVTEIWCDNLEMLDRKSDSLTETTATTGGQATSSSVSLDSSSSSSSVSTDAKSDDDLPF